MTEKQHQEWKKDLEELHKVKAERDKYKKALEFIMETSEDCEWRGERECYETAEQALKGGE